MNGDDLKHTLNSLLTWQATSNPAFTALLGDYAKYHAVLIVLGGALAVGLLLLSAYCWLRLKKTARGEMWTFEMKVAASFGVLSGLTGLLMTLLVLANASYVLNPRAGFAGVVDTLGHPQAGSLQARRYQAFDAWLHSGSAGVPALVQTKVQQRLAWQRPKAILSGLLLLTFLALGLRIWQDLIRTSRLHNPWTLKVRGLLAAGVTTVSICLLLMLMLIGNTQATFAPLTITMLYG